MIRKKLDDLGRFVIPIDIRNRMNLSNRDSIGIVYKDGYFEVHQITEQCIFCKSKIDIRKYNKYYICRKCVNDITQ